MDQRRRLYLIKLIVVLIFVLLVLLVNNVRAERDFENDHKSILLDFADENEDDVSEYETQSEEHLELLSQVSVHSSETEREHNDLSDNSSDDFSQYGDELLVEDDDEVNDDLEPVYAGSEDYEEVYTTHEYEELPHCQEDVGGDDRPRPSVIVSTLDGSITSLDMSTGAVLWSHRTGGKIKDMLTSSMSKLEVTSRGEWVRLIPSLDGGIFRFDGDAVEALPVTAESLLHSSFKFNSDTIFTGGKSTEVWGMALDSGKLIYVCNSYGCKRQRTATKPSQMLVVKRVTQTVRAVDPKSGDERWNFSVGQHDVNVAGGGCDWVDSADVTLEDLPLLHFIIPEGVVMGLNSQHQLMWQQKLTSPVVNAWKVIKGELEQIDLFSTNSVPALTPDKGISGSEYRAQSKEEQQQQPALYVGVHQKQLYIQQSGGMRNKVNTAFKVFATGFAEEGGGSNEVAFPRVNWRPYLATALSRTPVVNFNERKHPLLINYEGREEVTAVAIPHQIDYPFDNGYFLYADEGSGQLNFSGPWEAPTIEEETLMEEVTSHIVRICFQIGPNTWLQLAGAVIFYAALHYLVLSWIMAHMRRHLTNQAVKFIHMALHHILANNPNILAIIQRIGVQVPHLPAPPPTAQEELPSLPSNGGEESQRSEVLSQFTSRYQTDFKPIQRLGRGGFGVVFQVYNKLDENEYAVKRITLPSKEASAERVKREVRALAKLNHTNIVRYYNSWLESPPLGWQDETEAQWRNGDALSNTVFTPEYEETQDKGLDTGVGSKISDEKSKDSLSGILKKLGHCPVTFDSSEIFSENQITSADRSNDDDDSGDSESSPGYYKASSGANFNDDSLDIVFDDSLCTANLSTKKTEKEDSFEVLFEHSEKVSETNHNNCDDILVNKKILKRDIDSRSFDSQPEKSQSVVFLDESLSSDSVHSTQNVVSEYSSHLKFTQNKNKDNSTSDNNVKRRRVQSQPPLNNRQGGEERPRTLSLGTTVEGTSSKVWGGTRVALPKTFLYIQMELCQKESLRDWLLKNCSFRPRKVILSMFNDIVRAVEYVHDNQLMHRDLKPSNIFFSLDNEIKIGDFGLVTQITESEQEIRTPADAKPSVFSDHRHTHRVGTQLYMSPEQVSNQTYDYKVDIYSLGLIFFEMLVPFATGMERLSVMSNLREGNFPDGFCDQFPDEAELLKLMLSTSPANRPTTRGIRARNPLRPLQGSAVDDILPEDHFRLNRQRSHTRSHSGSSFSFASSTSSS